MPDLFGIESVPLWAHGIIALVTVVVITAGAHWVVESAARMAVRFGISVLVIGLTVVAVGTSAPELATSLAGVIKNRYGISAGNVIGSDIFNLLGVLGMAGLLRHPGGRHHGEGLPRRPIRDRAPSVGVHADRMASVASRGAGAGGRRGAAVVLRLHNTQPGVVTPDSRGD
jgi:Ca2+/Na+ antiporter